MKKSLRVLAAAVAPVPIIASLVLAGTASASSQPLVAIPQNVSPAVATSARTADLSPSSQISFAVALKLRDEAGLNSFISQVGDPTSSMFHHFLTPAQFNARYAPTAADVAGVRSFLAANGIRVAKVSGNRDVIDAVGSAAQVEKAFATTMGVYQHGGQQFFANDSAPRVPAAIAGVVAGVAGLDNHTVRHPESVQSAAPRASSPVGFVPSTLHTAYNTGSLGSGTGQSVALWEFDGFQTPNVTHYDNQFGLGSSAPTTVSVDGANFDGAPGAGQGEVELDIEIVQAMAKSVQTFVYEAPNSDQGEIDLSAQIASEDRVSVTSISWGACEAESTPSSITGTSNGFKQGVSEGITYYSASGDNGSADCQSGAQGVDYPASDPNVSGVGGTTLRSSGTRRTETAWSGSGGGVSNTFATPSYQRGSNGHRTVPDVSGDANPATGYAIFSAGTWVEFGGTSCAAPLWSGFTALHDANSGTRQGNINPQLYTIGNGSSFTKDFHDITSGSNGAFRAGTGYDEVTGWGTYNGANLSAALH
ncbi:MAG TPA: S53 family peptidase [Pseudonocardiaceae bacterium]|nr:S53 family peptidase [Pseudonocardiaceae bacterium]